MKKMTYHKFMTGFWLAATVISAIVAMWMIAAEGWQQGSMYLIFPVLAGMAYGARKFVVKRVEGMDQKP